MKIHVRYYFDVHYESVYKRNVTSILKIEHFRVYRCHHFVMLIDACALHLLVSLVICSYQGMRILAVCKKNKDKIKEKLKRMAVVDSLDAIFHKNNKITYQPF